VIHGFLGNRSFPRDNHICKSSVKLAREEYNVELERQKAHQGYTSSAKTKGAQGYDSSAIRRLSFAVSTLQSVRKKDQYATQDH
jgi:hypothetical protein